MNPRTIASIEATIAEKPENWAEHIAWALLGGGYSVADPEELGPIVAEEFGGLGPDCDQEELELAAKAVLSRSPVLADRAALALTSGGYDYPDDEEVVVVGWPSGQPALIVYVDGSAIVDPCEPWADWGHALVRLIEEALEGEGQAVLRIEPRWATAAAAAMADQARRLAREYGATVEA